MILYNRKNEISDWRTRLLTITRRLQSIIPFDYLVVGRRLSRGMPSDIISFLRIGPNEYQFIGVEEFLTISHLKIAEFAEIHRSSEPGPRPIWYNEEKFKQECAVNPMKRLLAGTFGLRANFFFPFFIEAEGVMGHYSFYSRQPGVYQAAHAQLLGQLRNDLCLAIAQVPVFSPGGTAGSHIEEIPDAESIVDNCPGLQDIMDQVRKVALFDTSVLLLGETGTGKEKIAHSIHRLSGRASGPLVKVNCGALPQSLFESELFGHEKGAFTGAAGKRIGKFEQANGGTIFLDEIGETPLDMQVKLLRVLQEREVERLGGKGPVKIDVRVIAATNKNLENEVAEGRFRSDLYYRINVFPLVIPPLRVRQNDIEPLAIFFANTFFKRTNRHFPGISVEMLEALKAYHWPGNIRELQNVLELSVVLHTDNEALDLKRPLGSSLTAKTANTHNPDLQNLPELKKIQTETEKHYLIAALKQAGGRVRGKEGAAQLLNINPSTMESKLHKLGIDKRTIGI